VTIRGQEQDVRVAVKSKDVAAAEAEADAAKALAVAAREAVETARQVEVANRGKAVTLVKAEEKAREASISIVVAAEAEKTAARDKAEALRVEATGERDAAVLRAAGTVAEGAAAAEALSKKNQAQNELSPAVIAQQVRLAVLAALPAIVEQSVKPLMNIESIRIAEIGGLGHRRPRARSRAAAAASGGGGLADQVVASALRYRTAAPMVDSLLREVGLGNRRRPGADAATVPRRSAMPAPRRRSCPTPQRRAASRAPRSVLPSAPPGSGGGALLQEEVHRLLGRRVTDPLEAERLEVDAFEQRLAAPSSTGAIANGSRRRDRRQVRAHRRDAAAEPHVLAARSGLGALEGGRGCRR
jgi:hypothetical protein